MKRAPKRAPYPWEWMTADQCQARWANLAIREPTLPVSPPSATTRGAEGDDGKILELLAVEISLNDPRTTKLGDPGKLWGDELVRDGEDRP